jgi:hypothetical protein
MHILSQYYQPFLPDNKSGRNRVLGLLHAIARMSQRGNGGMEMGVLGGVTPQKFTYLISNVLCGLAIFWLRGEIPHWLAPFGYIP